ncbi:serine/threonine protein kinase [Actinomadura barringtoniae]|uniref:Serine/threonine protein kinase n=1 Tax=Actinomadura barringtoniae TaxID=1427535 RepID=A0A939PL42_9ACTN|nr:serine/threonine-protein kinase [Actinomadura barringtoniae]MBO2454322.1 serine/threonine protein kinase [Actinomadura barringtoniae]
MTSGPPSLKPDDPRRLGPYELTGRLGDGAQGVVYLGRGEDGRQVAIKLLLTQLGSDHEARARFARELAVLQRVAGFCTAQVLASDVAGERPYIVSEYVPGPSLDELVRSQGPRTGNDLDRLAIGTATALTAIHRAGIVHRDFKPANVLMSPDGPRVIDFGIARPNDSGATISSGVLGTPSYMAPEQVAGAQTGPAADIFAWGSTMAFAARGRAPFGHDSVAAVLHRVASQQPDLSGLPQRLGEIIAACLARDPSRRPTAQQLLLRLLGEEDAQTGATDGMLAQATSMVQPTHPAPHMGQYGPPVAQSGSSMPQSGSSMPQSGSSLGHAGSSMPQPGLPTGQPGAAYSTGPIPPHAGPYATHPGAPHPGPNSTMPPPPPPGKRRTGLIVGAAVAGVLILVGGTIAGFTLLGDDSKPKADTTPPPASTPAVPLATGPLNPTPEAQQLLPTATGTLPSVLNYDYRSIDIDIQRANSQLTQRAQARLGSDLSSIQTDLVQNQKTIKASVLDTGVLAASPGRVSFLSFVRRVISSPKIPAANEMNQVRYTMVRQPSGDWLIDDMDSMTPDLAPWSYAGTAWPTPQANEVLKAARTCMERDQTYDYRRFDKSIRDLMDCSTGNFKDQVRLNQPKTKADFNRRKASATGTALEAAIKPGAQPGQGTVLVSVIVRETAEKRTTRSVFSYWADMRQVNGRWLMAKVDQLR